MPEHYPRNVKQVTAWCPTCRKQTMHRVDDRRLGSCLEHSSEGLSRAQLKRQGQQELERQQPMLEGL